VELRVVGEAARLEPSSRNPHTRNRVTQLRAYEEAFVRICGQRGVDEARLAADRALEAELISVAVANARAADASGDTYADVLDHDEGLPLSLQPFEAALLLGRSDVAFVDATLLAALRGPPQQLPALAAASAVQREREMRFVDAAYAARKPQGRPSAEVPAREESESEERLPPLPATSSLAIARRVSPRHAESAFLTSRFVSPPPAARRVLAPAAAAAAVDAALARAARGREVAAVARDLWQRGFWLSSGLKFGADLLVYQGPPRERHSRFLAIVLRAGEPLSARELVRFGRLGSAVKKTVLLCSVAPPAAAAAAAASPPQYVALRWDAESARPLPREPAQQRLLEQRKQQQLQRRHRPPAPPQAREDEPSAKRARAEADK
jgi:hypothetical protein